ncbi:MAG: hypothetical protein ACI4IJ_01405 [Acutalibacteraceae bacterium]|nr:hypothetical protein [Bacillota bacterium]
MKSRREYFESRRLLMIASRICYALSIFLIIIFCFVKNGFATIAAMMFLILMIGITCSLYAHRNKEYLFCPKCGSKNIVKTGFFGIPLSITDTCPDCKQKINIDKSINKD